MADASVLTRRNALWLMAAGAGSSLVATSLAGEKIGDNPLAEWSAVVQIEGCPITSANVSAIDIGRIVFPRPKPEKADRCAIFVRVVVRAASVPGVKKELQEWFRSQADARVARSINVFIFDRQQRQRSYHFTECFPVSWATGQYSAGTEAKLEEIEVQVERVEMA